MKTLSPEQAETLQKPLDPKAVSQHPTKPYLSTIKAIYVIERFNEVFGIGGWFLTDEIIDKVHIERPDKYGNVEKIQNIVIKTTFEAPEYGIKLWSYGGNDNPDLGDAYKGAVTDAITKIGSYLYVGMDVFKGLAEKPHNSLQPLPEGTFDTRTAPASSQSPTGQPQSERECKTCHKMFMPKFANSFSCFPCYKAWKEKNQMKLDGQYDNHYDAMDPKERQAEQEVPF